MSENTRRTIGEQLDEMADALGLQVEDTPDGQDGQAATLEQQAVIDGATVDDMARRLGLEVEEVEDVDDDGDAPTTLEQQALSRRLQDETALAGIGSDIDDMADAAGADVSDDGPTWPNDDWMSDE